MLQRRVSARRSLLASASQRRFASGREIDAHARVALTAAQRALVERTDGGHVSITGDVGAGKTTVAVERVLWLDTQRDRRVLALGATRDAALIKRLDRMTAFHALERRGHRLAGVREWTQHTLEELGMHADNQRVLSFGQLTAFLMHHAAKLPLRAFHERLATASSLQLRRSVADMVRFFTTLEAHGVQPAAYASYATTASENEAHSELAHAYGVYRALLHRHDVLSWDGLVLDLHHVLSSDRHCLDAATREFTDVVVDDLDRLTPAMVALLARVLQQPHLQSTMSCSHGDDELPCPRMHQLHQLLESMRPVMVELPVESAGFSRDRTGVRRLARQVLTGTPSSGASSESSTRVVTSLAFDSFRDETHAVAALIQQRLSSSTPPRRITVFCPTKTDASAISQAFLSSGLHVNSWDAAESSRRRLLFDEPGIDALFSLLVALWLPSDAKHLYNVLRSEWVGFPAVVLSRLMETHHRHASHATLTDVLATFIQSKGLQLRGVDDATLATTLASAETFLETISECRDQCHSQSVAKIVQHFLSRLGHLEKLLDPQTPRDARQAIALAAFLQEIETAQRIVESVHVPLVVPYLAQLQAARVLSVGDDRDDSPQSEETRGVRVLPLTRYTLDNLHATQDEEEEDGSGLVIFMAMRDAKFPGRLKRITWPLPTTLLAEPLPIQTRQELLAESERLVHDILVQLHPSEMVVSFARGSGKKPDKLSRVLEPLWTTPSGDEPPLRGDGPPSRLQQEDAPPSPPPPPPPPPLPSLSSSTDGGFEPTHLSYSQIAEYTRCPQQYYLSRVLGLRSFAEDDDNGPPNLAMMFGSAVHAAIAAFGQRLQQGETTATAKHEAHRVLDQAWQRDGFLSQRQEAFFFDRAQSTLRGFLSRHDATATVVAVEQTFDCLLGRNGDVPLRGVWDRVDRLADGSILIREFKTNPSAQRRTTSAQDTAAAQSLQLQIYLVAYEQLHGETPRGATLEVLEEEEAPNAVGFVEYSEDLRDRVDETVDTTIKAIRRGEFTATPGFLQCALCPYASSACQANAVESEDV